MSRGAMTMRADVERDVNAGSTNSWGTEALPAFEPLATVPCRVFVKNKQETRDDEKVVVVQEIVGIFPSTADVVSGDRIAAVKDRRGQTLFSGPLAIQAVAPVFGRGQRHKRAVLEGHNAS